jgi:hypothetical protein
MTDNIFSDIRDRVLTTQPVGRYRGNGPRTKRTKNVKNVTGAKAWAGS